MRISVLSLCIASSLLFVVFSPVYAVTTDELPKYANDRFYPKDVTRQQQENTESWLYKACFAVGGFAIFDCEGLRTYQIISPNSKGVTDEQYNTSFQPTPTLGLVRGISTKQEQELAKLEKELDTATTSAQVLGISDGLQSLINSIFGGGENESGFINSYKPNNAKLCEEGDSDKICTEKLAIALQPASVQKVAELLTPTFTPAPTSAIPNITSNPPQDEIPVPGGSEAEVLSRRIRSACTANWTQGVVASWNVDCLNTIMPKLSPGALREFRNSAISFTYLQCVGLVRGANIELKGEVLDNGGNAIDYAWNIPSGYHFVYRYTGAVPRPGDLMVWNTGAYGHIAYVAQIYDNETVLVLEANWGIDGMVETRNVWFRSSDILGWLTNI